MPSITLPIRLEFLNAEFVASFTIEDFEFVMEPHDSYSIAFDLPDSDDYYTLNTREVIQVDPGGKCWVFMETVIHEEPEDTIALLSKFKKLYGDRVVDIETTDIKSKAAEDHGEPSALPEPQK